MDDKGPESQPHDQAEPSGGFLRRRLGRGLNSLLGHHEKDDAEPVPAAAAPPAPNPPPEGAELIHLNVQLIERNPFQPRKDFDLQALNDLIESVREHGVLQPLLVRALPEGRYQLIAGERRLLAARDAGLTAVPCRVMVLEDKAVSEVAIIENLQREDLNELEKASAFQTYLDQFGCTIEVLAKKMGKDRSTISNSLRLLELPNFVKEALRAGKVTAGHARSLLPLEEEAEQIAMCQRIQSEGMSVRATEAAVRAALEEKHAATVPFTPSEKGATARPPAAGPSNHVLALQDELRQKVGAKVEIKLKGKNAGKMIIHFNSNDDFERIVDVLRKTA